MFFSNLKIYHLVKPMPVQAEELHKLLGGQGFQPCLSTLPHSTGWTPPLGEDTESLAHTVGGATLICLKHEEKVIPASSIRDMVEKRAADLEKEYGRVIGRKERQQMKEEMVLAALPTAFIRTTKTYAYIDHAASLIVVDASSDNKAEALMSLLRQSVEGLGVRKITTQNHPSVIMTNWVVDAPAPDVELGDVFDLQDGDGATVRFKSHDIHAEEVKMHLDAGKQIVKLAINWNERVSGAICNDLSIKQLRFNDVVHEQVGSHDDNAQLFDAEFALMTGELRQFIPAILQAFGGLQEAEAPVEGVAETTGPSSTSTLTPDAGEDYDDPFYPVAMKVVQEHQRASVSLIQRTLKIGYNRAARMVEEMEKQGAVSPMRADGTREVLY
jgi:recombination associated protein RdgC